MWDEGEQYRRHRPPRVNLQKPVSPFSRNAHRQANSRSSEPQSPPPAPYPMPSHNTLCAWECPLPASPTPSPSPSCAQIPWTVVDDPSFAVPSGPPASYDLTVVLDLDETLVYAREGQVQLRPGARELLSCLHVLGVEILVWTAGERNHAMNILHEVDPDGFVMMCICRSDSWIPNPRDYHKDLRMLGRDLSRTLMVDNAPECIRANISNSIVVEDFHNGMRMPLRRQEDHTLITLALMIVSMVHRRATVPEYLASSPLLTRRRHQSMICGEMVVYQLGADVPPSAVTDVPPPVDPAASAMEVDGG
eukprot:NODE_825_length_1146_cov_230.981768_g669_i0.p1 GENE.NODE_825_length_1146_cov_230.981768_g669_i0~~NODE_825_length_1146_cov_230.981768_g669_i0.p1  ORF type:complete len:306 (-),score=20.17 NODE_825_length_1146_cov_230.981768_g669_i0:148-1065(-)